ncbi:hypothetical protein A2U01_0048791 [Trifolium medium]|uniref:Uncharacterized protein n=1 Tax=Trifolium medium TaxID=97028 RepID=A0A392QUP2_9FABA|nr:hypothetical protein [Trifolium medium]
MGLDGREDECYVGMDEEEECYVGWKEEWEDEELGFGGEGRNQGEVRITRRPTVVVVDESDSWCLFRERHAFWCHEDA